MSIRTFFEQVGCKMFWSLLGYIVAKACTSPRNLTWFTRPFLLVRGWGLGTRLGSHVIVWGHMYLHAGSCDCMVSQVLWVIKSSIQSHNFCMWLCVITCQAVQSLGSYIESHNRVGSRVTCTLAGDHVRSHVRASFVPRKDTRPSPTYTYCKQLKAGWGLGTCEIMWDHMWSCEITWSCLWAMEPYAECLLFILGEKKLFLRCCISRKNSPKL